MNPEEPKALQAFEMWGPVTMLLEKCQSSGVPPRWSMTRVVALMFAVTICTALVLYARGGHDLTWPFAAVAITTLLAVPLQALLKYLQEWISSSPGKEVISHLVEKFVKGGAPPVG